jgi:putative ABC transport system substrate-binding protein
MVLAVLVAPLSATAQQAAKMYRVGYISPGLGIESPEEHFREGLREMGYVEAQNLVIEWRFAKGKTETFPRLAAEIVRLNVDCILTIGVAATRAARQATATIPIVMGSSDDDPVQRGFIASFARPGGNVTGIISYAEQLAGKRLQLLKELVPSASRVAILWPPFSGGPSPHLPETQVAARALGIQLQSVEVRGADGLEQAFDSAVKGQADALIVVGTGFINSHRPRVLALATKTRLPAIYTFSAWAHDGGLMSYASEPAARLRRAASYVDRIFKGAKPAELPVEQPTKFELIVNLKAAKAISLTVPPSLRARADHVIAD